MRERKNWLKTLGFADEARRMPDDWKSLEGGLFLRSVTFPQRPNVQAGDGIVYYAAGTGLAFAAAEATSHPYKHDDSDWSWRVDVRIIASAEFIRYGVPLDHLAVDGRDHGVRIRRRSHVNLTQKEFDAAVKDLSRA